MADVLRLMAFADTHASIPRGVSIARRAKAEAVHAVICAGDFSAMGAGWEEGIAPLVLSERKLLCVPGNHEPPGLMARVVTTFPWVIDLDGATLDIGPFTIAGFGASGMDHDSWEPEQALDDLATRLDGCARVVLVSHVPPLREGVNERMVRAAVLRIAPELVIAGHRHRLAGRRWRVGPTRVACVGPRGSILTLPLDAPRRY